MEIGWASVIIGITTFLSGLYGGVGFFTAIGGNPAISRMSDKTFAEFWQHIDYYMAARMKIFGPVLLLSQVAAIIVLLPEWNSASFWLMVFSFIIIIIDLVFTLCTNHPLNKLIQSWRLDKLPSDVQQVKQQVVQAFNMRLVFMMTSFALVLLSVWFRKA